MYSYLPFVCVAKDPYMVKRSVAKNWTHLSLAHTWILAQPTTTEQTLGTVSLSPQNPQLVPPPPPALSSPLPVSPKSSRLAESP